MNGRERDGWWIINFNFINSPSRTACHRIIFGRTFGRDLVAFWKVWGGEMGRHGRAKFPSVERQRLPVGMFFAIWDPRKLIDELPWAVRSIVKHGRNMKANEKKGFLSVFICGFKENIAICFFYKHWLLLVNAFIILHKKKYQKKT